MLLRLPDEGAPALDKPENALLELAPVAQQMLFEDAAPLVAGLTHLCLPTRSFPGEQDGPSNSTSFFFLPAKKTDRF